MQVEIGQAFAIAASFSRLCNTILRPAAAPIKSRQRLINTDGVLP